MERTSLMLYVFQTQRTQILTCILSLEYLNHPECHISMLGSYVNSYKGEEMHLIHCYVIYPGDLVITYYSK